MTSRRRSYAAVLRAVLLAVALTAYATATPALADCPKLARSGSDDGIGGSGFSDPGGGDEDGIGGSGRSGGDEDGIGGSGLYGTVTGFGSICLNGRRIVYEEDVPVTVADVAGSSEDLAVGQVVRVEASDEVATRIDVRYAVVGTVESVDVDSLRVDDVDVRVVDGLSGNQRGVEVGARIAVSGLWHPDGSVVATRIDAARSEWKDATALPIGVEAFAPEIADIDVEGYVVDSEAGAIEVGRLRFEADLGAEAPAVGDRVRVRAARDEVGTLRVRQLDRIEPPRISLERPDTRDLAPAGALETHERGRPPSDRAHPREAGGPPEGRPQPPDREGSERIPRPEPPDLPSVHRPRPDDFRDRPRGPRGPRP